MLVSEHGKASNTGFRDFDRGICEACIAPMQELGAAGPSKWAPTCADQISPPAVLPRPACPDRPKQGGGKFDQQPCIAPFGRASDVFFQ